MNNKVFHQFLKENYNIPLSIILKIDEAINKLENKFNEYKKLKEYRQIKVIHSFRQHRLASSDFLAASGYGYGDIGRDKVDSIYATIFGAEDALVRPSIASGTHAITIALQGLLSYNDELLVISGKPYDTLEKVIGLRDNEPHSLKSYGIKYRQIDLIDNDFNTKKIINSINKHTGLIYIQRSTGYSDRPALSIKKMEKCIKEIRKANFNIPVMVDNCYGEFTEKKEPTDVGADIIAGSLIKNPGGGIAQAGGYIAGNTNLIDKIANRLTAPGLGRDVGLSFGTVKEVLQGLYFAPTVTYNAITTALILAQIYTDLGFRVVPDIEYERSDIVQMIELGSKEAVIAFCEGVQEAGTVDAFFSPTPSPMPGYTNEIIMASAGFVEGSSIEISADGPLKDPYNVFYQGGLTSVQGKLAVALSLRNLNNLGLVSFN